MKKPSRSERYELALKLLESFEQGQALMKELQCWFDNMPENLKSSERGQAIEEAIGQLYKVCDNLVDALTKKIYFPGACN